MNKYCEGIDCAFCGQDEPCIYREANRLYNCLQEIREIAKDNLYCEGGCGTLNLIIEKVDEVENGYCSL